MNNNLTDQFKNQLKDREIRPSENAWEKLSEMMEASPSAPHKKNRLFLYSWSIAAVVVLLFGWFWWVNFQTIEIPKNTPQLVEQSAEKAIDPSTTFPAEPKIENRIESSVHSIEIVERKEIPSKNTQHPVFSSEKNSTEKQAIPVVFENQLIEEDASQPILAMEKPVEEIPEEKKSYVDPEMLLYSIENNQTVQKTKEKSHLVIIDLNK